MRITSVTVSRLKAGPKQYENERIEVTAEVPKNKTPTEAVAHCRAFIAKEFGESPSDEEVAKARAVIAQHDAHANL